MNVFPIAEAGLSGAVGLPAGKVSTRVEGYETVLAGVMSVNADINASAVATRDLAVNGSGDITHAMMLAEQARIEFELMVQIRNKLVEGFQELMRTQA